MSPINWRECRTTSKNDSKTYFNHQTLVIPLRVTKTGFYGEQIYQKHTKGVLGAAIIAICIFNNKFGLATFTCMSTEIGSRSKLQECDCWVRKCWAVSMAPIKTAMFALNWYGSVNLLLSFTQPSQNELVTSNFDLPIPVKYLLPIQH